MSNVMPSILGKMVQFYIHGDCACGCVCCSSKDKNDWSMDFETFCATVANLKKLGVEAVELFANDSMRHPKILDMLDYCWSIGMICRILTVGPVRGQEELFWDVATFMEKNPKMSGLVFSVDYLPSENEFDGPHKKANAYFRAIEGVSELGIPTRVNTVISPENILEAGKIAEEAVKYGAWSCCYMQTKRRGFLEYIETGKINKVDFFKKIAPLGYTEKEIAQILRDLNKVKKEYIEKYFNQFRSADTKIGELREEDKKTFLAKIAELRETHGGKILPTEEYLQNLDGQSGCLGLLQQGVFPQIKVGPKGEVRFCCDMHAAIYGKKWAEITPEDFPKIMQECRTNIFILLCLYFNPCSFSINRVKFTATK